MAKAMQYTIHFVSERTSYKPELSDFKGKSISDGVQNLGNTTIWEEESFERTSYEPELSDINDQSISDRAQNMGNYVV
ncbi:unnamed protein product [Prunus armeniaca]